MRAISGFWVISLCFSAHGTAIGRATRPGFVQTPVGYLPSQCVHDVPHGARIEELADGRTTVTDPADGSVRILPICQRPKGSARPQNLTGPLPPNYDGWLEYAAFHDDASDGGFDAFTSVMSVPDVPKGMPDLLYIFPGLQNIDWIPKVDPEPTVPFDIIQPVLQFPQEDDPLSGKWGIRSWYVTVNANALRSKELAVAPGDSILCNMTRTGPTSWMIDSTIKSSGKHTTQHAKNERLAKQPWAYGAVLECYGCLECEDYPQRNVTFTDLALFKGGKRVDGVNWQANPKNQPKKICKESISIGDSAITISFQG